jgi:hypothetical protein
MDFRKSAIQTVRIYDNSAKLLPQIPEIMTVRQGQMTHLADFATLLPLYWDHKASWIDHRAPLPRNGAMHEVITFQEALERASDTKHLLAGNGFSRACRNDIFSYSALFNQANFDGLSPAARNAFGALNTTDFEVVIRALKQAALLASVYQENNPELSQRLNTDADGLRELLATTIAASHPARPADIPNERYAACRTFLKNFNRIYTVNYDLLLYWALMQQEIDPDIAFDDGFREPEDGPADYVTWDVQRTDKQNIFYLHGGMHIFDAGAELQKFTWCNTGVALIDQIRDALETNRFPLFVAEGSYESKLDRIQHSGFLNRAYRSFAAIGGTLFMFGLSFGEADEHILKLLDSGKVKQAFISLHGDPSSEGNTRIVQRAELMIVRRPAQRPLSVEFFDADSAGVWG